VELKEEEFYLKHFRQYAVMNIEGVKEVESRDKIPYTDGFDTDDGEFCFMEEYDFEMDMEEDLFLITSKAKTSLNSQFKRERFVYLHPSLGFTDGEEIEISSEVGRVVLPVKNSEDLRSDCVLIYSATPGVNNLTTDLHSIEGKSAVYQEKKVKIKRLKG